MLVILLKDFQVSACIDLFPGSPNFSGKLAKYLSGVEGWGEDLGLMCVCECCILEVERGVEWVERVSLFGL